VVFEVFGLNRSFSAGSVENSVSSPAVRRQKTRFFDVLASNPSHKIILGVPETILGVPEGGSGVPDFASGITISNSGVPESRSGVPDFVSGSAVFTSGVPESVSGVPDFDLGIPEFGLGVAEIGSANPAAGPDRAGTVPVGVGAGARQGHQAGISNRSGILFLPGPLVYFAQNGSLGLSEPEWMENSLRDLRSGGVSQLFKTNTTSINL
jgi:hypothetical protein